MLSEFARLSVTLLRPSRVKGNLSPLWQGSHARRLDDNRGLCVSSSWPHGGRFILLRGQDRLPSRRTDVINFNPPDAFADTFYSGFEVFWSPAFGRAGPRTQPTDARARPRRPVTCYQPKERSELKAPPSRDRGKRFRAPAGEGSLHGAPTSPTSTAPRSPSYFPVKTPGHGAETLSIFSSATRRRKRVKPSTRLSRPHPRRHRILMGRVAQRAYRREVKTTPRLCRTRDPGRAGVGVGGN